MNNAPAKITHRKTISINDKTTYTERTVLNGVTNLSVNAAIKSKSLVLSGGDVYINAPLKVMGALLIEANHAYINADIQADWIAILSDDLVVDKAAISAKKVMLLDIEGSTSLAQGAKLKAAKLFATKDAVAGLPSSLKVQVMDKPMLEYKELKDAIAEVQNFGPFVDVNVSFGEHNYEVNFNYHNGDSEANNPGVKKLVESIFTDAGLKAPWIVPVLEEQTSVDEVHILPVEPIAPVITIEPVLVQPVEAVQLDEPVVIDEYIPVIVTVDPAIELAIIEIENADHTLAESSEAMVIASLETPILMSETLVEAAL